MSDFVEVVVVGAGVVGLAVARALAAAGHEVIVLEKHRLPGQETSSRNSGVIHSGIYYPAGSLKARWCVRGRDLLYEYCERRTIAFRRCGKLIVAQNGQIGVLQELMKKGVANGVTDLQWLESGEARLLEPAVQCQAAVFSPSTGIVDAHEYMSALQADLETHGGQIAFNSELFAAQSQAGMLSIRVRSDDAGHEISCRYLINCAGLHALDLLHKVEAYPASRLRKSYLAKGNYFACRGTKPFKHLVYPIPNEAGLGVHATLDLDGTVRFGPDVEWTETLDYTVDTARARDFYAAIREYWPALADDGLQPAYAGIRPKLVGADSKAADFLLETADLHGVTGLINLLGIESPGLTASLAIGEEIARLCA